MDLAVATPHQGKLRRDYGLQNMVGMDSRKIHADRNIKNLIAQRAVRGKIATFVRTGIFPQQLSVPRQYATTQEGVFIYKILKGREIAGYREDGVRIVVQENAKLARFVMSPLFQSEYDARQWAKREMGADL